MILVSPCPIGEKCYYKSNSITYCEKNNFLKYEGDYCVLNGECCSHYCENNKCDTLDKGES